MKPLSAILFFIACTLVQLSIHAQVPLNWEVDEIQPGNDLIIRADPDFFIDGNTSCFMELLSSRTPYLLSEPYQVTPGVEYFFSVDVFDDDTSGQVKIYADFTDINGFTVAGRDPQLSVDTGIWQTISWSGQVPVAAVRGQVTIKFHCQPSFYVFTDTARIWIDHVIFTENGGQNKVANGSFEEWSTGIYEEAITGSSINVYPNPASGHLKVYSDNKIQRLAIIDITGRIIMDEDAGGEREITIPLIGIPPGIYFITVAGPTGNQASARVIIR